MLDIADRFCLALGPRLQQFFQPRLALAEWEAAQIQSAREQQIERVEDEIVGLAVGNRSLQRREIRRAVMVERDDLAIEQHIRQRVSFPPLALKLVVLAKPFAWLAPGRSFH